MIDIGKIDQDKYLSLLIAIFLKQNCYHQVLWRPFDSSFKGMRYSKLFTIEKVYICSVKDYSMLLIYCDFAILVLRAQGSLLWFKMDYYMLLNYGIIHWYPLETALLDNYPLNWF